MMDSEWDRLSLRLARSGAFSVTQVQSALDPFDPLREPVIAGVLISQIGIARCLVRLQAGNGAFQAGQPVLDLAHIVLDTCDVRSNRPQVPEHEIFHILNHLRFHDTRQTTEI